MKKVRWNNTMICPYCKYKHKPTEGTSSMSKTGVANFWCAKCGKKYYSKRR